MEWLIDCYPREWGSILFLNYFMRWRCSAGEIFPCSLTWECLTFKSSDMECTDDVYDVPEIQKEEKIQSFKSPQHEERLNYQHPDEVLGGSSLIDGNSGESKGVRRFRDFIFQKSKTNTKDKKKKDFQKTTNGSKGDEDGNDNIRLESIKRIPENEWTNGMGDRYDYLIVNPLSPDVFCNLMWSITIYLFIQTTWFIE